MVSIRLEILLVIIASLCLADIYAFVQLQATTRNQFPIQMTKQQQPDTLDDEVLQTLLNVAIDASKRAGDIILGNAGGAEVTKSKANSRDLLTLIDPLCEQTIRDTVLEHFPSHDFLGEEDVDPGAKASAEAIDQKLSGKTSDFLWIVDPVRSLGLFVWALLYCCF
jgi:myo-inositol-1(or 4)-monophosphatase